MEDDPPSSQVQPNLCLQPTPFDAPQNQDPFLDSFFQKSFSSPAALPSDSGSSPFASFSNTTPGSTSGQQPTVNLFTSTPEGQRAPPLVQPLQSQTAQQGISLLLDPFQTSSGMSDPFQASSGVSDPFQASSGMSGPLQASSGMSDPFHASTGPFQASCGMSDPFQASSDPFQASSGPFQGSSGVSDPFQASTGPFQASSSVNNPLQSSSGINDSFQASSGMNSSFQASSGMNDLLQSPSGMASNFSVNQPQQYQGVPSPTNSYNITAGSDSTLELSNPLYQSQNTSSYTAFFGQQQPPSQQVVHDPFGFEIGGQAQHSFAPQFPAALVPGPLSFSTGPPGNFMVPANNPFASDVDSSCLFSMPQSTFSQSANSSGYPPNPKGSISGNAGDGKDLFAELIPLAVGASPSRKTSTAKQQAVKQQEEHAMEFGTINFEDIKVQRPKTTEEQTQPDDSSLTGKPLEEKRNQNSDVVEDSFLHTSDQQKVSNEKPSSHGELLKTANGDNSQELLHKDALTSAFGNDSSTLSDFETAFASADSENDKRNISEAFESPTSVAPPPSLITFETGFDDHFVADNADATSNTPSGSNGDDFWGGKTESTATSWIAFS